MTPTRDALIAALVLDVFAADARLSVLGPADRSAEEEGLRDRIIESINDWIGESGDNEWSDA